VSDARRPTPITILLADDDPDDVVLTREALASARLQNDLRTVSDGVELLDYLRRRGKYAGGDAPRPDIILLDLNMPRMDGREALTEIRSDPALKAIPIVVLTTSRAEADIVATYELGVNSFISKPVTFPGLVEVMSALKRYWFEIVAIPSR
jgi:CheY-like chemotaxis protein